MATVAKAQQGSGVVRDLPTIPDEEFVRLFSARAGQALRLARYLATREAGSVPLTRPLLGEIFHQATELEELLDSYGARNNRRWRPVRSTVAAAKLFADVGYVLLHIQHSIPAYRLMEVGGDFVAATEQAIAYVGESLLSISRRFVEQAAERHICPDAPAAREEDFAEYLPEGRLAHTCHVRRDDADAGETVTYLATAFLNQAAESEILHVPQRLSPEKYAECIPSWVSEEKLRRLQHQFHNLQSMYDTFVADTDVEDSTPDLRVLRGHISVIFHLLETATGFAHHYERHLMNRRPAVDGPVPTVDAQRLLGVLMDYSLVYASRYLVCGRALCQEMIRRFAKFGRIEVAGPRYRGFHVRPSTLVAKIVHHYGGQVRMELEGETFDAGSPMDIFRANEKINRQKRNWLVRQVGELPSLKEHLALEDPVQSVRRIILALAEQGKVVIYQRPIPVQPPDEDDADKSRLGYVLDELKRLQATGVIDIEAEIPVAFVGDERVLRDLKLLAEHGYGEDNFGNNIPLPEALSYVRR